MKPIRRTKKQIEAAERRNARHQKAYKNYLLSLTPEEAEIRESIREELYEISKKSEGVELDNYINKIKAGTNLSQADFYEFMERAYKRPEKDRPFRKSQRVIVNKLFEVIKDELINSRSGVVLDKIGYMAVWVTPEKVRMIDFKTMKKTKIIHETDGYFYNVSLFTDIFRNGYAKLGWTMGGTFSKSIKRGVFRNVAAGKKYILRYRTVKSMFNANYSRRLMEKGFA